MNRKVKSALNRVNHMLERIIACVAIFAVGPLMVVLICLIKLASPGPSMYRVPRVGRNGETFGMLKFRFMVKATESTVFPLLLSEEVRPRMTRLRRFIRKQHFDDLPQLWNVACGEMSLLELPLMRRVLFPLELKSDEYQRIALPPGYRFRNFLSVIYPRKVFERVFAETLTDMEIEHFDALAENKLLLARWIVVRGHLIVVKVMVEHAFDSTLGKLIRDIVK